MLYNSALRFRHRLYADLETVLYQVHLFKPLSQLMKHSALYVRNSVLQKAFQALTRCARPPPREWPPGGGGHGELVPLGVVPLGVVQGPLQGPGAERERKPAPC